MIVIFSVVLEHDEIISFLFSYLLVLNYLTYIALHIYLIF